MPSYDFECLKCGNVFQEVISLVEYEKKSSKGFRCPKCNSRKVDQLVSGVTVETSRKS